MSHAALLSGKYTTVLYNEYNPLLVDLLRRCLRGEFEDLHTIPFVSRAQFKAQKESDGFIKYVWSFGNAGRDYFTKAESEPEMKRLYNYWLHGGGVRQTAERKKKLFAEDKALMKRMVAIERMQGLAKLQGLPIEVRQGSYTEYRHKPGDVVYCDPPYEGTTGYGKKRKGGFDHQAFYEWVYTRGYPVYFSSYEISDKRFKVLYELPRTGSMGTNNNNRVIERLYINKAAEEQYADRIHEDNRFKAV